MDKRFGILLSAGKSGLHQPVLAVSPIPKRTSGGYLIPVARDFAAIILLVGGLVSVRFAIHCWISLSASGTLHMDSQKPISGGETFLGAADTAPSAKVSPNPNIVVTLGFINVSPSFREYQNLPFFLSLHNCALVLDSKSFCSRLIFLCALP